MDPYNISRNIEIRSMRAMASLSISHLPLRFSSEVWLTHTWYQTHFPNRPCWVLGEQDTRTCGRRSLGLWDSTTHCPGSPQSGFEEKQFFHINLSNSSHQCPFKPLDIVEEKRFKDPRCLIHNQGQRLRLNTGSSLLSSAPHPLCCSSHGFTEVGAAPLISWFVCSLRSSEARTGPEADLKDAEDGVCKFFMLTLSPGGGGKCLSCSCQKYVTLF